jgi:hypothetical protein
MIAPNGNNTTGAFHALFTVHMNQLPFSLTQASLTNNTTSPLSLTQKAYLKDSGQ